jgi:HEPN domain-containing protein
MNQNPNITAVLMHAIDTLTNGKQPPTYAMSEAAAYIENLLRDMQNTPPQMQTARRIISEINAEIDRHQEEINQIYKEMNQ